MGATAAAQKIIPPNYNSDPLIWVRRRIEQSKSLGLEDKSHVLLWLKDIVAMATQDQRHRAMLLTACACYAQIVRTTSASLKQTDPRKSGEMVCTAARLNVQLSRALRLAGLPIQAVSKGKPLGKSGPRRASEFAPPRRKVGGQNPAPENLPPDTPTGSSEPDNPEFITPPDSAENDATSAGATDTESEPS